MRNKIAFVLAIALSVTIGCNKSNKDILTEITTERAAIDARKQSVMSACLVPLEISKYKSNILAILSAVQFCQDQTFFRAMDSVKRGDNEPQTFLRSCFTSYIDFVGPIVTPEQGAEALKFCEGSLSGQKDPK